MNRAIDSGTILLDARQILSRERPRSLWVPFAVYSSVGYYPLGVQNNVHVGLYIQPSNHLWTRSLQLSEWNIGWATLEIRSAPSIPNEVSWLSFLDRFEDTPSLASSGPASEEKVWLIQHSTLELTITDRVDSAHMAQGYLSISIPGVRDVGKNPRGTGSRTDHHMHV